MITASNFHPMRGHVEHGNEIDFNGQVLTLQSTMRGWVLVDKDGKRIGKEMPAAYEVASFVHHLDGHGIPIVNQGE